MKENQFPVGWDQERVAQLLAYYEEQSEEEMIAEDEAAYEDQAQTIMEIPTALVPVVRKLIAQYQQEQKIAV